MINIRIKQLRPFVYLICMMCAGCGWQLQGVHHISAELQPLYLQLTDTHSEFSRALQTRLQASGIQVVDDSSQAGATLQVNKDEVGHRVISVSDRNTPQEYEVFYNLEIVLKNKSGTSLLSQPLTMSHTMTYNETAALAKQREENVLIESMAGDLADQLLREIRRL